MNDFGMRGFIQKAIHQMGCLGMFWQTQLLGIAEVARSPAMAFSTHRCLSTPRRYAAEADGDGGVDDANEVAGHHDGNSVDGGGDDDGDGDGHCDEHNDHTR